MGNRSSSASRTLCVLGTLTALAALAGCAPPASTPPPGIVVHWDPPAPTPAGGSAPDLGGITPFSTSGAYTFDGPLAHGSARLEAIVVDMTSEMPPTALGTGSFEVPVDGASYASSTAEAMAATIPDDTATLVLAAYVLETDALGVEIGSVIWLVVRTADAVAGASVAIDGENRVALFGRGPIMTEAPEISAAAATGTITFGAVDLALGGRITATLDGEFGRVEWSDVGPGPGPGPGPGGPPVAVAPGDYVLALSEPAEVVCDGSMSGRETELGSVTPASIGVAGGAVTVADDGSGTLTLSGAAVAASFAASSVSAGWDSDASVYLGFVDRMAAGPGSTTAIGSFVFVAPTGASALDAFVGVVLAADPAAPELGMCQIGFAATLTPATR